MMSKHVILTSSLGGSEKVAGKRIPAGLPERNGLAEKIRGLWKKNASVLMICADPEDAEKNDMLLDCYRQSFPMNGLEISGIEMCDGRNEKAAEKTADTDVIVLTGGHVPTQNAFFRKIGLREKLADYRGLVLAWSAGSMNAADIVYAGPELPGEAVDPGFRRWIPGLGLTKVNIFPHFQALREEMLDGLRLIEDITYADSMGHEILALNDGSYILIDEEGSTMYGEAYSIRDGRMTRICREGECLGLPD